MLSFLIENDLLSVHQHGFLPRRSTQTALLQCLNDWMTTMEIGDFTDVIYIDLKKAFDSVVHSKLLQKCEAYGFSGKLYTTIYRLLS